MDGHGSAFPARFAETFEEMFVVRFVLIGVKPLISLSELLELFELCFRLIGTRQVTQASCEKKMWFGRVGSQLGGFQGPFDRRFIVPSSKLGPRHEAHKYIKSRISRIKIEALVDIENCLFGLTIEYEAVRKGNQRRRVIGIEI